MPGLPWSQEAFLANLHPSPGGVEARRMTVGSGRRWLALCAKPSPLGSLLRTLLASERWASPVCLMTWKVRVIKSRWLIFRLVPSERRTAANGSGLLPTPQAHDVGQRGNTLADHHHYPHDLSNAISLLPTPNGLVGGVKSRGGKRKGELLLGGRIGANPGLKLQPAFVEWMMGFPENWTNIGEQGSAPSATPLCPKSPTKSSK